MFVVAKVCTLLPIDIFVFIHICECIDMLFKAYISTYLYVYIFTFNHIFQKAMDSNFLYLYFFDCLYL